MAQLLELSTDESFAMARKFVRDSRSDLVFSRLINDLDQFTSKKNIAVVSFDAAAHALYHRAIANPMAIENVPSSYDWASWRLAVEYGVLFYKTHREEIPVNPVIISSLLRTAFGLWAIGQVRLAANILGYLVGLIELLPEQILETTEKQGSLATIGLFFKNCIGIMPAHRAFDTDKIELNFAELQRALLRRNYYSDVRHEGGLLLPGPVGDIIPIELIYLNALLPPAQRDETLSAMQGLMAATTYPNDALFIELDTRAAIAGL